MKKFLITFFISLACFSLLYTGIWKVFLDENSIAAGEEEIGGTEDLGKAEQKVKNEILFLLAGVDAKDVKKSKGTRTDTLMLMRVNFETGEINLLSIPRDTRVLMNGREDKINHAHAFGGISLTMKSIEEFLNLDLDYYVKVDYKAVREIVDAIGGVEIDVPRNMRYKDPTADPPLNINIKKGLQVLDGNNAHDFLRYRSGYAEGDLGRVKAQQMFMKELVKQVLKPKNILKLPKLAQTYFEYVDTNIPFNIVMKGIGAASKIDMESMKTNTIPGHDQKIKGVSYLIYNKEETDIIIKDMFGDYVISQ